MKRLSPAQYRSMPWKNGKGTTIEIAVFPEQAFLNDFQWRVSRAAVMEDGGFSYFEGIDRSLALLQGQGMRLNVDSVLQQVDANNNIAVFAGDASTYAELIAGPITDFNLMTRRSSCTHALSCWEGEASRALPSEAALLYCARGSGTLTGDQNPVELQDDESVQFSAQDQVTDFTLHCAANSRFYCVQIFW